MPASERKTRSDLVEAYERLRERALVGTCPACSSGLAILVEHGMGAWIDVCSEVLPERLPVQEAVDSPPPRLAADLAHELVMTMTQMVLSNHLELVA